MWPESSSFYIRNGNFGDSLLCCSPPRCPPKQILVGGGAATGGKGKLHFTPTMEFIILPIVYVISFWPPEKSNYKTLCILYTSILFYLFIQHAAQDGETSLSFLFRRTLEILMQFQWENMWWFPPPSLFRGKCTQTFQIEMIFCCG